jgi:hypothetical protein
MTGMAIGAAGGERTTGSGSSSRRTTKRARSAPWPRLRWRSCVRVLVVDDGSSDGTAEQLAGLPLTLLRHAVNQGKAAGLRTAFATRSALGATCVVTIDGDGQHDPRDAPSCSRSGAASPTAS